MKTNDGGPAFPLAAVRDAPGGAMMSHFAEGMSLRDWFAGQALLVVSGGLWQSMTAADFKRDDPEHLIATAAYKLADALLEERSK